MTLTNQEKTISTLYRKVTGTRVDVYNDGCWIVEDYSKGTKIGTGVTPQLALADYILRNGTK